ncbi:MAG: histidinol-phosphate aminotransferase family protein [Methanosarcinales archaeon]|nr:histidinol-phosphate aminotransferase family protein [Methanosarcinales archaeon]
MHSDSDISRFMRREVQNCTPCVHGGRIAEFSGRSGMGHTDPIDFSANLNPLGAPDIVASRDGGGDDDSGGDTDTDLTHYPDNRYLRLRAASADFVERYSGCDRAHRITAENIVPANGSSELIRLFAETTLERGDRVIIPAPTFDEYAFQCQLFGGDVRYCDYSKILELSSDEISDASLLFLCNPNNPTGNLIAREDVKRLAERCSDHETFLFVDEAFIELSDPAESVAHLVFDSDFVFVIRSLTKVFAVPGLRLGFGIASGELAELLNRARLVWNVGAQADAVGTAMIATCIKSNYIEESIDLIAKERGYLEKKLTERGFSPLKSDVNFILVDVSKTAGMNAHELAEGLLDHGILVRDCATFVNLDERYIRIAVRTREENRMLVQALDAVV